MHIDYKFSETWPAAELGIIDIASGRTLSLVLRFSAVSFSSDSNRIITASPKGLRLWDAISGQKIAGLLIRSFSVFEPTEDKVSAIALAPNGHLIISGLKNGCIQIQDLENTYFQSTLSGHSEDVTSIAVTPNGKKFISGSLDSTVCVWNIIPCKAGLFSIGWTAKLEQKLQGLSPITFVAVSPAGSLFAAGGRNGTVMLWDLNELQGPHVLIGDESEILCIAIDPDTKKIASGHKTGVICIWSV